MTRASKPPSSRNANAVTIYRSPIFLWSTVESQPVMPGFVFHISSSSLAETSACDATLGTRSAEAVTTSAPLLQCLQIGADTFELGTRYLHGRHPSARFDGLRIGDPTRQRTDRMRQ